MENRENPSSQEKDPSQERLKVDCYVSTRASEYHPDSNEDTHFLDPKKGIFGVLDGMGGMQDGQWCSQTSRQIIEGYLLSHSRPYSRDAKEILTNAINLASSAVYRQNEGKGGTTATLGLLCQTNDGVEQIAIANVGDSRAYLFHEGQLTRLTVDDSMSKYADPSVQNELDSANREDGLSIQAKNLFRSRNQISNFVGASTEISSKIVIQTVTPGDILILTTDGVHDNLTTTEISQIISQNTQNPELISQKLTNAALSRSREKVLRSKPDDMTALVTVISKDEKNVIPRPEINKPKSEFTPKVGQEITLQRTSGDIEGGWRIFFNQDGMLGVSKGDVMKRVKVGDVERFNRPAEIKDIPTSKNIEQLKYTIKKLGGLSGSNSYYSADDLLTLIDNAFANNGSEASLKCITRTGGLRTIVEDLIKNKKENKQ